MASEPTRIVQTERDARILRNFLNKRGSGREVRDLMRERAAMRAADQARNARDLEWMEAPEIRESWDGPKPYFLEGGKASDIQRAAKNLVEQAGRPGGSGVMGRGKAPGFRGVLANLEKQLGGKGKEAFQLKREVMEQVLDRAGAEKLTWDDLQKSAPDLTKAWTWSVRKNAEGNPFLRARIEGKTGPWAAADPHSYKDSLVPGQHPDVPGQAMLEGGMPPPAAVAKYSQAVYQQGQGHEDAAEIMMRQGAKIEKGQVGGGNVVHMERASEGEPWWKYDARREENIKRGQKEKIEGAVGRLKKAQEVEEAALTPAEARRLKEGLENYRLTGVFGVRPRQTRGVRSYEDVRSTVENPERHDTEMGEAELLDDVRARKRMERDLPSVTRVGKSAPAAGRHPDMPGQMDLGGESRAQIGRILGPWSRAAVPVEVQQRRAWPLPKRAVADFDRKRVLAALVEGAERGDPRAARLVEVLGGARAVAKGEVAAGVALSKALKAEPALLKLAKILMRM